MAKKSKKQAPKINELVITKKQLVDVVAPFVEKFERLPYMNEDVIVVTIDEDEERDYKALKYVKGHFETTGKMTEYLLDKKILTYKVMCDIIGVTEKRLKELLTGDAKKVTNEERRALEIFINEDLYEHLEDGLADKCSECTQSKKCGQPYFVRIVSCEKFKKKKAKKK